MTSGSHNFTDFPLGNFSKVAFLATCEIFRSSKEGAWPKWPSGIYHSGKHAYGNNR